MLTYMLQGSFVDHCILHNSFPSDTRFNQTSCLRCDLSKLTNTLHIYLNKFKEEDHFVTIQIAFKFVMLCNNKNNENKAKSLAHEYMQKMVQCHNS